MVAAHQFQVFYRQTLTTRWLANIEPSDLLVPFPSELMKIRPISTRVNKPQDDDLGILEPIEGDDDCKPLL